MGSTSTKSLERFKTSHNSPWVLHSGPRKTPIVTSVPFCRGEGSPAAIAGRTWTTNGTGLPHCSPETDWWRRWGRSGLQRWPAVRQWWHGCRGSGSSAMEARLGHRVRLEAQVGAREKLRVAGWLWALAEQQDQRWRQWREAAGGRVARARRKWGRGVL
jgi:hypothetical protein